MSYPLPKFLVTTVAPKNPGGTPYEFDYKSKQMTEYDLPVFLLDVKYNGNLDKDKGDGTFSGTAVSQKEFTEALQVELGPGQDLVFYVHGYSVPPKAMITRANEMQENFNNAAKESLPPLVVSVDWACNETDFWPTTGYHDDQKSAKNAGLALWNVFSGFERNNESPKLHVVAHSMGNRVLRFVGKAAVTWDKGAGQGGKQLLDAAPQGLKDTKDLFENLFFVAADIPDTVFMSPTDGTPETNDEQTDHALKSGIAALSVMSKRMHVLHANDSPGLCTDMALNASITQNHGNGRLGAFGPFDAGKPAKVWEAVSNMLDCKEGAADPYLNVYVQACAWNHSADGLLGHRYQAAPETVQYYLKHM